MAQLHFLRGDLFLEVVDLVLEPLLLVGALLPLLLEEALQFVEALFGGEEGVLVELVLRSQPLDQRLLVLVVRTALRVLLAAEVVVVVLPAELLSGQLLLGGSIVLPVLDEEVLLGQDLLDDDTVVAVPAFLAALVLVVAFALVLVIAPENVSPRPGLRLARFPSYDLQFVLREGPGSRFEGWFVGLVQAIHGSSCC